MKKAAAILLTLLLCFSNAVSVMGGTQLQKELPVAESEQVQGLLLDGNMYSVGALPGLDIVSYEDSGLSMTAETPEDDSSLAEVKQPDGTDQNGGTVSSETEDEDEEDIVEEGEKDPDSTKSESELGSENDEPLSKQSSALVQMPVAASAAAPIKETGARGFVVRLYSNILSRSANEKEITYYVDAMSSSGDSTAAQVVNNFFNSKEFKSKSLTDEEYVRILYVTILGRNPDASGLSYYVDSLQYSATRNIILANFVASKEFASLCKEYGVAVGSITLNSVADKNPGSANYAKRLYTEALGRRTVQDWEIEQRTTQLISGITTAAQLAHDVFDSLEFKNRNLSNAEYVTVLYKTILGRNPDSSGLSYYVKSLESGVTRNALLNNFINSNEFASLCKKYSVPQGSITFTKAADLYPNLAKFVTRQYTTLLGRSASGINEREVENRVSSLVGGASAARLSYDLIISAEFKNRNLSDDEYITVLYQSLLGRNPDTSGKRYYQNILAAGGSRELIFQSFVYSPEFAKICASYGMEVGTADIGNIVQPKNNSSIEHGVDVSKHQGNIDWQRVKNAGYTFAIIRATTYENGVCIVDPYFVQNIKGAKNAGIKVGAYCYTYSYSIGNASSGVTKEVNTLLSALATVESQGYKLEYPIFWDVEANTYTNQASRADITALALHALKTLRNAGYYSALYTYTNFANTRLYMDQFSGYDFWVAQYGAKVTYTGSYTMWQYSSKGSVPGISGNVDLNYSYKDYASIIKSGKWNKW